MKKYLFLLVSFFFVFHAFAKIITVSNNPNSPGQYTNLDSAINAASPGDILLITGSVTDYNIHGNSGGSITITKPLILYGQGYDPRKDQALASIIGTVHFTPASSGTIISGFLIGNIYIDQPTNSITISRCKIGSFGYNYGGNGGRGINGTNYNIRENIIGGSIPIVANSADILIENNIIEAAINSPPTVTTIKIYNNYFPFAQIAALSNAAVYNNIFYYKAASATANPYVSASVANCDFKNNLYYNTTNANPLQIGVNFNTGDSNINANPLFVNINLTTIAISRTDNFILQPGSPAINAGVNHAADIGPEGGSVPLQYPYSGEPAIPQIKAMNILNPVVAPNGKLNVTFKANSNN